MRGGSYCGRVISIALSACMVSSFVPVGAFAEVRDIADDQVLDLQFEPISNMTQTDSSDVAVVSDTTGAVNGSLVADQFTYQINNDGTCSIVGYQGDAAALDIPSMLNGITVSSVAAGAFKDKGLEAVTVPESVTSIGEGAFDGCNLLQVFLSSWDAYDVFAASESGYSCGENTLYFVSPKGDSGSFGPGDDTGFGIAVKKQLDVKSAWCEITSPSGETVRAEMIKNDRGQWRLIVDASWVGNGNCEVDGFVYSDASGNETTILTTGFFGAYDLTWSDNGDGTCTVTGALGRSAELAVPAELGGLKVSAIGEDAFRGVSWVESLSLPEGLRSIGDGAFRDCASLESIELPDGLSSLGFGAFQGCTSLASASVPGSVRELVCAFEGCSALKSVSLGEGVESLQGMDFYDCSSLASVKLPSTLRSIGAYSFSGCASLPSVDLPSALGSVGTGAFDRCSSLAGLELPASVDVAQGAFQGLAEGTWIKVPTWELFYKLDGNSSYLDPDKTSVACTSADPEPALSFAWSDNGDGTCTVTGALGRSAELAVPAELGGLKVSAIGEDAFRGVSWVESLSLPEGLRSIGDGAFRDCASLESIELPDGLSSLGFGAFQGCTSLASASVPGSVRELVCAFEGCSALKSVSLGEGVESLQGMDFYDCSSLASVKLPSTLRSIGAYSFSGCASLPSVDLPSALGSVGTGAFDRCSSLAGLELPASVDVAQGAFQGLAEGTWIKVPTWELFYKLDGNSSYLDPDKTTVAYSGPTTVYGTSLTLEGEIGVNLYVALPDSIRNLNDAYAMVGMPGQAEKISLADAKKATAMPDLEGVPMYVFTTNVYAKNMADQLKFAVYDGDGNQLPLVNRKGAAISDNAFVYSVKSYYEAAQKAEGSTGSSALTNLAKMMVDYGAAAQIFFGYQTDALSGDPASKEATAVTSSDLEPYRGSISGSVTGLDVAGYTLTLEETTTLSYYFSPQLGHTIDEYVIKVDGVETTPVWSGQRWKVTVSNIPAQNLDDFHTVTATSKKTGQMATVHACALSYASSVLRSKPNSNLEALCQALYLYNQAANTFFDSSES